MSDGNLKMCRGMMTIDCGDCDASFEFDYPHLSTHGRSVETREVSNSIRTGKHCPCKLHNNASALLLPH